MPVLEAMTLGVPVVAADRGALPEVLGDAGPLVDPEDPGQLAAAIERMIDDEAYAAACAAKGSLRARHCSAGTAPPPSSTTLSAGDPSIAAMMRIGIDARELAAAPTGVGRYLGGLLAEWADRRPRARRTSSFLRSEPDRSR